MSTQQSKQRPGTRLWTTIPETLNGDEIDFRFYYLPFLRDFVWENTLENEESNLFLLRSPSWPEAQCWWGNAAEWRRPSRQCSMQVQTVCRCVHWLLFCNVMFSFVFSGYDVMKWDGWLACYLTQRRLCQNFSSLFIISCWFFHSHDSSGDLWLWHDADQICPQWQTGAHYTQ